MSTRETSAEIDKAAARWVARLDGEPLSTEEALALDAWLRGDPRRLGAFAKAQAVSIHSERARALGPNFNPARVSVTSDPARVSVTSDVPGINRRRAILLTTAAAAVLGIAITPRILAEFGRRIFTTARGETRVVPLEDGSVITLNTASRISVCYAEKRRDIKLLEGEALFDVAKDPTRPFTVEAGETQVLAVGTSFTVLFVPKQPVKVLVREGEVALTRRNVPAAPPVRMAANTRALAPSEAPIIAKRIAPREVDRELVWREGRISFEGDTLKDAAEMFARYSDTRIIIDDPSVAAERIVGLFISNDPVGFSKAVGISLRLHVEVGEGEVHLSR